MKDIIKRAKAHDKAAFTELIYEYECSMYRTAKAILASDEDAADAIQETLMVCWERIGGLRNDAYFKTWLTRILINKCYDILYKRKRETPDDTLYERGEYVAEYDSVEWYELIDALEEKYRTVLVLYYVEGFKVKEIAKLLGLNVSTVKARLVSARKQYERYYMGGENEAI